MISLTYIIKHLAQTIDPNDLNVPKGSVTNNTVTDGLQILFGIFAAVAVLIIAISALRIVISRGKSEDVSRARDAIIFASIGLVISMMAFTIVTFVVERV